MLADKTMEQAIAHFTEYDVVAAPVNTIPQAAEDPHPLERRAMVEAPGFLAGEIAVSGDYWRFSRTPVSIGTTPQAGEHNEEVLSGILDYRPGRSRRFGATGPSPRNITTMIFRVGPFRVRRWVVLVAEPVHHHGQRLGLPARRHRRIGGVARMGQFPG